MTMRPWPRDMQGNMGAMGGRMPGIALESEQSFGAISGQFKFSEGLKLAPGTSLATESP